MQDQLLTLALQVDSEGILHGKLSDVLPSRLTKKMKRKNILSKCLVCVFFAMNPILQSKKVQLPGRHSSVQKSFGSFLSVLVLVCNHCQHELENEHVTRCALNDERLVSVGPGHQAGIPAVLLLVRRHWQSSVNAHNGEVGFPAPRQRIR